MCEGILWRLIGRNLELFVLVFELEGLVLDQGSGEVGVCVV